jgi:hypothetical protein
MFGRGICEKYQSRDEKFPEPTIYRSVLLVEKIGVTGENH